MKQRADEEAPKKPKKKKGIFKRVATALVLLALAGTATLGVLFYQFGHYDDEKLHGDPQSTLLFDAQDRPLLSIHGTQNRVSVPLYAMPENLRNAFLAAEDLRFYQHMGFDVIRIIGALWADIRTGSLSQGASTITQQLVKGTHLTPDKNFLRKLNEAYFAFQIEQDYTKDEILAMYMNHVYLGNAAYGVQAAAQAYFGVDVEELTLVQCASLAAILKAPSNYAPHIEPENNKRRRDMILGTMLEEGMITQKEAEQALGVSLTVRPERESGAHGWFTDAALDEARALLKITYDELLAEGYRIYTTQDTQLQSACDELYDDPANFPGDAADGTPVQAALVVCDTKTSQVLALVGGREYSARRVLNRATQSQRQPGSTFKPFAVYTPALERFGYTAATPLDNSPADFDGYAPRNFGDKYGGWVTLRAALARSLNVPAVRVLDQIGVDSGREYASRFGLPLVDEDAYLPMALGALTQGVTPLELCGAYAALGNGGTYQSPYLVRRIEDFAGRVLYTHQEDKKTAVSPETAYVVTDMLSSAANWGTASRLGALGLSVAGKTGTVAYEGDLNRDAWTAAYTPERSIVVWMGFDQTDAQHAMGKEVTGGALPAALATKVLELAQERDVPFERPGNIQEVLLDKNALEKDFVALRVPDWVPRQFTASEVFLPGTAPVQWSDYWVLPDAPPDLNVALGPGYRPTISFTVLQDLARYRLYRARDGEEAVEIGSFRGSAGQRAEYVDAYVERGAHYTYYVVPEHADAVDAGVAALGGRSAQVDVMMPLFPLDISGYDELFETKSTPVPAPSVSPTPKPTEVPTPSPSPSPDNLPLFNF